MRITEESYERLVVKKIEGKSWQIMLIASLGFFLLAMIISAAKKEGVSGNQGRAPASAVIFIFPIATVVFYFLDRRENRKALVVDNTDRTVVIRGSKTLMFSFDEISGFCLGKASFNDSQVIELELKNGLRVSSGIDKHRRNPQDVEPILQALSERLNAKS